MLCSMAGNISDRITMRRLKSGLFLRVQQQIPIFQKTVSESAGWALLVYIFDEKCFWGEEGRYPVQKISKLFFWDEISQFIYQSTRVLTETTNSILFLLKNVIKKQKLQNTSLYGILMQMASYLTIFAFFIIFFNKNNIKFVIFVKIRVDWYINWDISFQKSFQIFCMGYPQKNIFRQKYTNGMPIDAVFDGDYESASIFGETIYIKNENRNMRVHFSM